MYHSDALAQLMYHPPVWAERRVWGLCVLHQCPYNGFIVPAVPAVSLTPVAKAGCSMPLPISLLAHGGPTTTSLPLWGLFYYVVKESTVDVTECIFWEKGRFGEREEDWKNVAGRTQTMKLLEATLLDVFNICVNHC